MPLLDSIYKTGISQSHEAGLQAVYDYALAEAAKAFVSQVVPVPAAAADPDTPPPADPVV